MVEGDERYNTGFQLHTSRNYKFNICVLLAVSVALCSYPQPCLASTREFEVVIDTSGQIIVGEERQSQTNGEKVSNSTIDGTDEIDDDAAYDNDEDDNEDDESTYREYTRVDSFPYYPEEFEGENDINPMDAVLERMAQKDIEVGQFIVEDFVVAGVNLGGYEVDFSPFLLYSDFDISSYIMDERTRLSWKELLLIRKGLERPTLSWYVDKVARKRWFAEQRVYPQPRIYFLQYKDELSETGKKEDERTTILENLPTQHGFCAKPTHMSMTMGNWLVDIEPNTADRGDELETDTKFTNRAMRLTSDGRYDSEECADSLAEGLQREAVAIESWALKNVRPGIVIEELFSHHRDRSVPPHEFSMFVIWGKVHLGQWNYVDEERYFAGFFYRDGTAAPDCPASKLQDWIPWNELVEIAERLSEHKDMFRVDMFVGVPRYSQESAKFRVVVSESEIHPTTMFCNPFIAEEMARLWIAGYKVGNYEVIPNDEVPVDFIVKKD